MKRSFQPKQRQSLRPKLRAILVVGAFSVAALLAFAFFLTHFFHSESSKATGDPMVVVDVKVLEDDLAFRQGTLMQLISGVRVDTRGKSNRLNLIELTFYSTAGATMEWESVRNLKLWATAADEAFLPVQQIGTTITHLTGSVFQITLNHPLSDGANYFWLTGDIGTFAQKGCSFKTTCMGAKIGTLSYEPNPAQKRSFHPILTNTPFYSVLNGDISDLKTWNSARDGSGKHPASFSNPALTFHIQSGHLLKNTLSGCLPTLIIERNGALVSETTVKADLVEIQAGGSLIQSGYLAAADYPRQLIIKNGGALLNNQSGYLPGVKCLFEKQSNVVLKKYSELTFSRKVTFGNLIIDADSVADVNCKNGLSDIRGNLEIRKTGIKSTLFCINADSATIGNTLIMAGGRLVAGNSEAPLRFRLCGDFRQTGGIFTDHFSDSKNLAVDIIAGELFYLKSGEFNFTGKRSTIKLENKTETLWKQTECNVTLPSVEVHPGSTLKVNGDKLGLVGAGQQLLVMKDAKIELKEATVSGAGSFLLDNHGIISTSHESGIYSDGWIGCIQTAKRHFSSSAVFIFNGGTHLQETGLFYTTPEEKTVQDLIIDKELHSAVVRMNMDLNVNGLLVQKKGSINKNGHQLILKSAQKQVGLNP